MGSWLHCKGTHLPKPKPSGLSREHMHMLTQHNTNFVHVCVHVTFQRHSPAEAVKAARQLLDAARCCAARQSRCCCNACVHKVEGVRTTCHQQHTCDSNTAAGAPVQSVVGIICADILDGQKG